MKIIENEHIVCFDVDQTLFMHNDSLGFDIINPYSKTPVQGLINDKHVDLMKQYKARNLFIIVWSKAGVKWAETVVKSLQLEQYVDLIMTKPDRYVDDLQASEILGERVYIK